MRYIFECDNEAELLELRDRLNALYPAKQIPDPKLDQRLLECDLTMRSINVLRAEGIETLRDLIGFNRYKLLQFNNLGRKSLNEIETYLESLGLELKPR
ncbi:MAG: DNA-directed RNA polymerase subunit alpha C-terminal domain-containing protein [Methylophilaceae bacterium]